jgi:HpcH/HpaI aldolase/citrate lyase family
MASFVWERHDEHPAAGVAIAAVCAGDPASLCRGCRPPRRRRDHPDLEDSVAPSEKEWARTLVPEAAAIVSRGGADVVVRINRPLRLAVGDIDAAVGPGVLALALPKVDGPEHVRLLAEIVDQVEAERGIMPGTTRFIAMVETAAALFGIAEIARAHPRLCGLNLGAKTSRRFLVAVAWLLPLVAGAGLLSSMRGHGVVEPRNSSLPGKFVNRQ